MEDGVREATRACMLTCLSERLIGCLRTSHQKLFARNVKLRHYCFQGTENEHWWDDPIPNQPRIAITDTRIMQANL